jgi:Ca-activated chloride channel homolog
MKCVPLATLLATVSLAASPDQFHANANVVLINATVLDGHDRPVRGLTRHEFRVYQEKSEQRIAYFSEEEVPLSLAVIFDVSGSMDGKLAAMRTAVDAVLRGANVGDEFALITFADSPQIAMGWSENPDEIQNRLLQASAHGETSLLDALRTGLAHMKKARNARRAMIVFSDGGDNHSRSTEREIDRALEESGVQIYAIDGADSLASLSRSPEVFDGPDLLDRICDHAGGRYFQADGKREFQRAAEQIARELRSQYLIGYVPEGANDGRFHHVRVQVQRDAGTPKVTVFWRKGYRAASE